MKNEKKTPSQPVDSMTAESGMEKASGNLSPMEESAAAVAGNASGEESVSRDEAERLAREAYLRGRNETIREKWIGARRNNDIPDPDDAASVFMFRHNVWND